LASLVKNVLYGGKNHLYTLFICLSDYLLIGKILGGLKSILKGFEFLEFLGAQGFDTTKTSKPCNFATVKLEDKKSLEC
jgi:hypothetical protein